MNAINIKNPLRDLPHDLSYLVSKSTLIRMSFEAVEAASWPRAVPLNGEGAPEPILRTLLTYCYSVGIFSSREIENSARLEHSIRYLCANDFPTWEQIRRFRRHNVSHLRETLARLIHGVRQEIGQPVGSSFFPHLTEADRRLRLAIEADSAALDDWAA